MASPTFQSHDSFQSAQIAPAFSLVPPYSSLNEHQQAAAPPRSPSISQVQSQSESFDSTFDSLPRKRARGEGYGSSGVEHSNNHLMVQPRLDSSESVLLEQNGLGFIKHWLCAFSHASLFNRKQMESLATVMDVPIETVEQLCNKLVRSQPNHSAGPLSNARIPFQAEAPSSVSLLQKHVSQDTSSTLAFTAVIKWVETRRPQCKSISDRDRLTRKGIKIYQCTRACGSAFARKEDWVRHELCRNYPQEGWVCNLPSTVSVKGVLTCSSCGLQNPDMSHSHPLHTPCRDCKTFKGRVFFREDHFLGHFGKVHHHSIPAREQLAIAHFRVNIQFPRECGFCNESRFESWDYRADHLAAHFKIDGKDMKDWKVTHIGGLHNAGYDDDDDDGHDEDGDRNEPGDNQDENNGEGAGNDRSSQGRSGASKHPPGDSGYGPSGRSGTSSGNKNPWAKGYQYTSQCNDFDAQLSINAPWRLETQYFASAGDKAGRPKAPSSHLQALSTPYPQRPAQKSDFDNIQGLQSLTSQSNLPVRDVVNGTGGAKVSSGFGSKHILGSECRESHCQKSTHHHFTEKLKAFTNNVMTKFQPFRTKQVVTDSRIVCIQLREKEIIVNTF
jgi:hypothetical protein